MTMKQGFEQPGRTANQADPITARAHSNPRLDTGGSAHGRSKSFAHRILLVILALLAPSLCWAQTGGLADMSLEELLNMRLTATGVMGIHHTHPKGEWMLSFSRMNMRMNENRIGTRTATEQEVLQGYMVTPTSMEMEMHMVGGMYAPTADLTFVAMVPLVRMSMDHVTRRGMRFTIKSAGLGDATLSGLYTLRNRESSRTLLDFGLGLPTGSIDERGDTPAGKDQKLPYPMQLGWGVFSLKPGLTYLGQGGPWNWGGHVGGQFGLGTNSNNYSPGNAYSIEGWGSRAWNPWVSTSLRTVAKVRNNIDGADPDLNPMMVPTADPELRGGKSIDFRLGVNLYVPRGVLSGNRFSIEFTLPAYQSLNGPQLATDWGINLGWQNAFRF